MGNHNCMDCRWRTQNSRSMCTCDESDRLSDYVTAADTCPEWEEKRDE